MRKAIYKSILNSLKDPILFADTNHIVRYMNNAAIKHYQESEALLNSNLLECHNDESQQMMIDILAEMRNGLEERLITDNDKYRIFMRSVRDELGKLLGYFERYEPPKIM